MRLSPKAVSDLYQQCEGAALPFEWEIGGGVDLDLLEIQLHSLARIDKLNFQESHFMEDLSGSDGYQSFYSCSSVQLSVKTFRKAFVLALARHGVVVEPVFEPWTALLVGDESEFDYDAVMANVDAGRSGDVMTYGGKLVVTTCATQESKAQLRGGKEPVAFWVRALEVASAPLTFFSTLRDDCYLTPSAAYQAMYENLEGWSRRVARQAVSQLRREVS